MADDERNNQLAEARVFALAAPVILPIIERRKKDAFLRLMQAHKSGQKENSTIVAELSAFHDIELEIKQKQSIYSTLEEKQHGKRNGK